MDSSLAQLRIFQVVARRRSFTAAARELHMSQPAVSRAVAELESSVQAELLSRTSRHVSLTRDGEVFLATAARIVESYDSQFAAFKNYQSGETGTVTIAALPSIASVVMPRLMASFHAEHPAVRVKVLDGPATVVAEHVQHGEADFGLSEIDKDAHDLEHEHLASDQFVAVLPRGSLLAGKSSVTWSELAALPFVVTTSDASVRRITDHALVLAGARSENLVEATQIATVAGMVGVGLGVTALPDLVLPLVQFADVVAVPLTGPPTRRDLGIIKTRDYWPSQAGTLFLRHIREEFPRVVEEVIRSLR